MEWLQYLDILVIGAGILLYFWRTENKQNKMVELLDSLINEVKKGREENSKEHKEVIAHLSSINLDLASHIGEHQRIIEILEKIREDQLVNDTAKRGKE